MDTTTAGRGYWTAVLSEGGATTLPRWTGVATAGIDTHETAVPAEVAAGLDRVAGELGVPREALVLAAHAKVLAALTGEAEVVTGVVVEGRALPCRLDTAPSTWRELVGGTARELAALTEYRDVAVDDLRFELGVAGPRFETELAFDGRPTLAPAGAGAACAVVPASTSVLAVAVTPAGDCVRLGHRVAVLDDAAAVRIAGYHVAALSALVADPDAEHGRTSLLAAEEVAFQVDGLAGPRRELPDRRLHELFEERVAAHPDRVAAVQGDRSWTYAELDARANRLGRALLARGLGREDVVAVVFERNLDWMAAVLAVFKAGGVYLPIEPHFPADRIRTTLSRADCRIALTEPGSTTTLDKALDELPDVTRLLVDEVYAEDHPTGALGVEVGPDQLAYIYFTSGSTGLPKGAMCEHAGMINHLYAKIDDLGIGEGAVVAEIAPQCFDISLWQLVSALLVGGRTHIIEQETILDVARFVDTVADGRVNVLQVVPSYLEVVLTYLEQHDLALPDLHCVSATGEALKVELAQRFFAVVAKAAPGTTLVNAYGLTETSDDTNHEVMTEPPAGDRMPLGPAVNNVRVYVVDEHLRPVPLGAPGLIAFSGVCVGRGYVNDPERTAACYLTDPYHPGERLYLGGDYGRWRPDGKLEFLGRRDSQVKISGFRIEIGEIDNRLLTVPGVRDGAVVVAEHPERGKYLVGFYSAAEPLDVDVLRDHLGETLPHYMIPAVIHWQDRLPLTPNGKINTKALTVLAGELDELTATDDVTDLPSTPTERRLAAAWAKILGIPEDRIGRHDHFFDRGGSSLSAVRLAVALDRVVSLRDVTRHPVLADLAELVDRKAS